MYVYIFQSNRIQLTQSSQKHLVQQHPIHMVYQALTVHGTQHLPERNCYWNHLLFHHFLCFHHYRIHFHYFLGYYSHHYFCYWLLPAHGVLLPAGVPPRLQSPGSSASRSAISASLEEIIVFKLSCFSVN